MHVIIPAAGRGTRLRPISHGLPKALAPLADTTLLDHAIDALDGAGAQRITVVGGADMPALKTALDQREDERLHVATQAEPRGQADAVLQALSGLADPDLSGPTLVLFVDTLHDIDLLALSDRCGEADGLLFVRAMPDPRAFGVAVLDENGFVARLVEKPTDRISDLAVIGVYYVRDGARLASAVHTLVERGSGGQTRGEFYLLDALQLMIDEGAQLRTHEADLWLDCGTPAALREASRHLLGRIDHEVAPETLGEGVVLVPPVRVATGARIEGSVVGPRVAVAAGATIVDSVVGPDVGIGAEARIRTAQLRDCLIARGAGVRGAMLHESVLAPRATVSGRSMSIVLGPDARVG